MSDRKKMEAQLLAMEQSAKDLIKYIKASIGATLANDPQVQREMLVSVCAQIEVLNLRIKGLRGGKVWKELWEK